MMQSSKSDALAGAGGLAVHKSASVPAAPDKVWAAIGDFSGIAVWHPAVESCRIEDREGAQLRVLTLKGGATLVEQLIDWDDAGRSYTYRILEGPLPVDRYVSTLSVLPEGEGSRIEWQGRFDAHGVSQDEAEGVVSGIYESGVAAIAEKAMA